MQPPRPRGSLRAGVDGARATAGAAGTARAVTRPVFGSPDEAREWLDAALEYLALEDGYSQEDLTATAVEIIAGLYEEEV